MPTVLLIILLTGLNSDNSQLVAGEPYTGRVELSCDAAHLLPGTGCDLILSVDSINALQYAGIELTYDSTRFGFEQMEPGAFFNNEAVHIADHLSNGTLAASVSSTTGEKDGGGELMILRFRIRDHAPSGGTSFTLTHTEFTDQNETPLTVDIDPVAAAEIPPYIIDAGMTGPGPVTIGRGSTETLFFRLQGEGITGAMIDEGRLTTVVGIINADELSAEFSGDPTAVDPAGWPAQTGAGETWSALTYAGSSDDTFFFEADFPPDQPTGDWLTAGRFRVDDQPYRYAGYSEDGGGFWDGESYITTEVTVTTPRVTLVHWSFDGENLSPDTGLFDNLVPDSLASFALHGAADNGWTSGSGGRAPNSNNWHPETDEQENTVEKYWAAKLTTTGYRQLDLSFQMNGSGTGPRDFELVYCINSAPCEPLPGGVVQSGESWSGYQISLPAEAAGADELELRWMRTGPVSISGADISTSGTNRIDEVTITGVTQDETEVEVRPGDADGSGEVTAEDVTMLAWYWMSRGPARVPQSVDWINHPVIRWLPEAAGHADTNGDGLVDYRDIMAIGRNFGAVTDAGSGEQQKMAAMERRRTNSRGDQVVNSRNTQSINPGNVLVHNPNGGKYTVPADAKRADYVEIQAKDSRNTGSLLTLDLPQLSRGNTLTLQLASGPTRPLLGLSAQIDLAGLPVIAWSISEAIPGSWSDEWRSNGRLLSFQHHHDPESDATAEPGWSGAWAHKGVTSPVEADELFTLTLRAEMDWQQPPQLQLQRISIMDGRGRHHTPDPETLTLLTGERKEPGKKPELPHQTRLHPNYPNPFNPVTVIPYEIAGKAHTTAVPVRLTIYDALGRRITTLIDREMKPGYYEAAFDAPDLSSMIYIYRLETPGITLTRKMTLLK